MDFEDGEVFFGFVADYGGVEWVEESLEFDFDALVLPMAIAPATLPLLPPFTILLLAIITILCLGEGLLAETEKGRAETDKEKDKEKGVSADIFTIARTRTRVASRNYACPIPV